ELSELAEGRREVISAADRVQERRVDGVHRVVLHLEPVARHRELRGRVELESRHVERVVHREYGLRIRGPHVREDQPAELERGVGALTESMPQRALRRLARRLENAAVDVEDPAVIAAADAPRLKDAELERRSAVRAVQLQQTDLPGAIAKDHEILAHDPDTPRDVRQVSHERDRLPEPSQIFAARGAAGTDTSQ